MIRILSIHHHTLVDLTWQDLIFCRHFVGKRKAFFLIVEQHVCAVLFQSWWPRDSFYHFFWISDGDGNGDGDTATATATMNTFKLLKACNKFRLSASQRPKTCERCFRQISITILVLVWLCVWLKWLRVDGIYQSVNCHKHTHLSICVLNLPFSHKPWKLSNTHVWRPHKNAVWSCVTIRLTFQHRYGQESILIPHVSSPLWFWGKNNPLKYT